MKKIFKAKLGFNLFSLIKRKSIIDINKNKILNLNPEFKNKLVLIRIFN